MGHIIWEPSLQFIQQTNIYRFMDCQGVKSYDELIQWSIKDIGRFWQACLEDLQVQWQQPYSEIFDDSKGLAWTRWFIDGKINLALNAIDKQAAQRPTAPALIYEPDTGEAQTLSYAELDAQVRQLAGALRAEGLQPGDPIALYMPMVPEMVVAFFAALKVGCPIVPVFSGFGTEALQARLEDAQVKLIFTADVSYRRGKTYELLPTVQQVLPSCPSVRRVVVLCRTPKTSLPADGRHCSWKDFRQHSGPEHTEELPAESTALILYTSGTTGKPKGCVHTHGGCQAQITKELAYNFDVKADSRFFWVTDIGWMMGPWELIGVMSLGGAVTIFEGVPNYPEPDRLWEIVERHQITHLGISPTAIRVLKAYEDKWFQQHDLSSLKMLGSTGEPWDPESYEWFFQNIGGGRCPIMNISGGTELVGCLLAPLPIKPLKNSTLQGPGLAMDVDVWDEHGESVRGEVGYLVCKQPAPSMTKGFLGAPERYEQTYFSQWPGVWSHGDWAYVDEDGFWFIRGRADDTIKIAGRRTGPAEIESVLTAHPQVIEAAAIGIPDEVKGQALVCFVVLKAGHDDLGSLIPALNETVIASMGKALAPKALHAVPALPKTRSAKIVRQLIKKKYLGQDLGVLTSVENPESLNGIPTDH